MPLRPSLRSIHPRAPRPRQVRPVSCPHCGQRFEVSHRAMSVTCPACTRPLEFNDMTLRTRLEGDVSTMGHVELAEPSEMIGRLVCGQFSSRGRFEGKAIVYGCVRLEADSLTTGEVSGRSLEIENGATTRLKAHIHPRPTVQVQAKTPPKSIAKLIRKPTRRLTHPLG